MSAAWQPYITNMMKDGHLSKALICGKDDALVWAASEGFGVKLFSLKIANHLQRRRNPGGRICQVNCY